MSCPAPLTHDMDIDSEPIFARWAYAVSDARSDPLPAPSTPRQIASPSPQVASPPPPPQPVQTSPGVWYEDDDILYSPEWPPVQQYLDKVREHKRMLPAASDLILALAALAVVRDASDIAHWIFWSPATYWTIGELVDSIALSRPRLVKTSVPWNGAREFKLLVNSWQQKFTCVVVQQRWYSTECTGGEAPKRNLRSTTDQPERTVNDYFGLVENEGPSRRRSGKTAPKKSTPSSPPAKRATRRPLPPPPPPALQAPATPTPADSPVTPGEEQAAIHILLPSREISPIPNRTSTRPRRKVTPSARSPRVITASLEPPPPEEPSPSVLLSTSLPSPPPAPLPKPPTHVRNRSGSAQSSASADTVVAGRSPSVSSVETAVAAPSSPKKRKADALDEVHELGGEPDVPVAEVEVEAEGMVTRNRAGKKSKSRVSATAAAAAAAPPIDEAMQASKSAAAATIQSARSTPSQPPSRLATPAASVVEPLRARSTRPRAKRVRV